MAQSMRPRRRGTVPSPAPAPVADEARLTRIVRADLLRLAIVMGGLLLVMVGLGAILR